MLTQLIKKAKENPILAFAWTLLTLSAGFIVKHEVDFPDSAEYLEQANVKINNDKSEYDKTATIFEMYKNGRTKSDSLFLLFSNNPDLQNEAPNRITVSKLLSTIQATREEISKTLIFTSTTHVYNQKLSNLIYTIRNNAIYSDSINAKAYQYFSSVLIDEKNITNEDAITNGIKEQRKKLEIEVSDYAIEEQLEIVRQEINANVRTAQRKANLFKLQSTLTVVCWSYIGLFIGGWLGYFWGLIGKRKEKITAPKEPSEPKSSR